jgi:hypothetical protein
MEVVEICGNDNNRRDWLFLNALSLFHDPRLSYFFIHLPASFISIIQMLTRKNGLLFRELKLYHFYRLKFNLVSLQHWLTFKMKFVKISSQSTLIYLKCIFII